jgi:hypothetical protein
MTPTGTPRAIPRWVWMAVLAALVVELWLAWSTHGTNDVDSYREYLDERLRYGAAATYEHDPNFNHPPFVFRFLLALGWIVSTTGLPFGFCLRLPAILAGFASFLLSAKLIGERAETAAGRWTLAFVGAAPVLVMVAGFHGNTDPIMVFFVLLSLAWIRAPGSMLLAGAAMGMSVNFKVVPLVFWPAVFLWLSSWRRRFVYFGAAITVIVVASLPVVLEDPALVARKVFGYSSDYGVWGIAWMLLPASRETTALNSFFRHFGRPLLVAILIALAWWMNRRAEKPPLFRQLGVLAFAFLTFTPGFGVQYLAWLVPWIAGVPLWAAVAFTAANGAYLFLVYTCWCQGLPNEIGVPSGLTSTFWRGLPWDVAHANLLALWRGPIVPFMLACWASIVVVLAVQIRAIARGERRTE